METSVDSVGGQYVVVTVVKEVDSWLTDDSEGSGGGHDVSVTMMLDTGPLD